MFFKVRSAFTVAAATLLLSAPSFAQVTQSVSGLSSYDCCWNQHSLGGVTLAQGTNHISALTGSGIAVDQGWGGSDPWSNQATMELWSNGTYLWGMHAIGGLRYDYSTQSFDVSNDAASFAALNTALGAIDWSSTPDVEMQM